LLQEIVAALDRRFPEGNEIYQRLARLLEEAGELAKEINHHEGMGINKE
jgi:NTP pyrophosphatase (non-canonical NTP hydrolase)